MKISVIVLVSSIVVGGGIGGFLVKPTISDISGLKDDIASAKVMEMTINAKKSIIDSQQKILQNAKTDKIKEIFPNSPGVPDLLVQVQNIAYQSGVSLQNISFTIIDNSSTKSLLTAKTSTLRGEVTNDLPTVEISASVIGVYSSIKSFLNLIENNVRIMDVTNVNLSMPQTDDAIEMSADFSINAYFKSGQIVNKKSNIQSNIQLEE